MAKQEMPAAMVGLVVSASVVFLASFGVDEPPRDDGPVDERAEGSDEAAAPKQEAERRPWLTDYSLHMGLIWVLSAIPGSPRGEDVDAFQPEAKARECGVGRTKLSFPI